MLEIGTEKTSDHPGNLAPKLGIDANRLKVFSINPGLSLPRPILAVMTRVTNVDAHVLAWERLERNLIGLPALMRGPAFH